MEEVSSAAEPC
ncbi:hypothetical protein LUS38_10000 [Escherichia coli]|nr:hypothetical protein [Escherichia coli]